MIAVYLSGFRDDFMNKHIWPCPPGDLIVKAAWLREKYLATFSYGEHVMHKLLDVSVTPHRIAAWSRWIAPHTLSLEEKASRQAVSDAEEVLIASKARRRFPEGVHEDLAVEYFGTMGTIKSRLIDSGSTWELSLLVVDPEYQRRGLATALVSHVLVEIDADSKKAYLEAMPAGYRMYQKLGWKEIELMEFDLQSIGVEESGKVWCMIRQGRAKS